MKVQSGEWFKRITATPHSDLRQAFIVLKLRPQSTENNSNRDKLRNVQPFAADRYGYFRFLLGLCGIKQSCVIRPHNTIDAADEVCLSSV